MPKRAVPSLDQAVRAAMEWFRDENFRTNDDPFPPEELVNFFFHGKDYCVQQFCSLIIPARDKIAPSAHVHVHVDPAHTDLAMLLYHAAQFGRNYEGARRAFAEFNGDDLYNDNLWSCFAEDLGYILRYGGIHVLFCELCREKLRPATDKTPHLLR